VNRHPGPLPVHHASMHAASTTPTAMSSYARRAAPGLLLAVTPRHRLVAPIPWTAMTPSTRHECL
jgi:hypothetical protein